jgi:hypothetical protein
LIAWVMPTMHEQPPGFNLQLADQDQIEAQKCTNFLAHFPQKTFPKIPKIR